MRNPGRRHRPGTGKIGKARRAPSRFVGDLYERLRAYAAEHGTTVSEVLKNAILEYIEEARKRLLKKGGNPPIDPGG